MRRCQRWTAHWRFRRALDRGTIDCNGILGCITFQNRKGEENSGVFWSSLFNWGYGGVGLDLRGELAPSWTASTSYPNGNAANPTTVLLPTWASSTVYHSASNNAIIPPNPGTGANAYTGIGYYYFTTQTSCTSGSTQPAFLTNGSATSDGGCTWNLGASVTSSVQGVNHYWQVTAACASGSSNPAFVTSAGSTQNATDNTCSWVDEGGQGSSGPPHITPGNSDYAQLNIQNLKTAATMPGMAAVDCRVATGVWIFDPSGQGTVHSISELTINSPGSMCITNETPTSNVKASSYNPYIGNQGAAQPLEINNLHTETCTNGVDIGLDGGAQNISLSQIGSVCSYGVRIESAYANEVGDINIKNINGCCHVMKDNINGFDASSETGGTVGLYYRGHPGTNTILTTASGIPSSFSSAVAVGGHLNQAATGNLAGTCTASGSLTCTVSFVPSYQNSPICTVVDQSHVTTVKASATTTTLTITTTSTSSDTFSYVCVGNPN